MDRTTRPVSSTCDSEEMRMRWHVYLATLGCLGLAVPSEAQTSTATLTTAETSSSSTAEQEKPPAAQAPAAPALDESRSLFELAPRQFEIGGRISSISGDPARFQRYQDLRDGLLFTNARYTREDASGSGLFRAS